MQNIKTGRDFPGGPVAKTLCSQSRQTELSSTEIKLGGAAGGGFQLWTN